MSVPLQSRLDSARECAEIGYALEFVVWQLNPKMMLDAGEQIERLQAVNAERLKEVIVGS